MDDDNKKTAIDLLKEIKQSRKEDSDKLQTLATQLATAVDTIKAQSDHIKKLQDDTNDRIADRTIEQQQNNLHESKRRGGFMQPSDAEFYQSMVSEAGLTKQQMLVMEERHLDKYIPDSGMRDRVRRFQALNDEALIVGTMLSYAYKTSVRQVLPGTITGKALQYAAKALTTTGSGTGVEWIPTIFSTNYIDKVTVSLKVAALFQRITMPHSPYAIPIATSDDVAFFVGENTSDNVYTEANVYPKFTPGTDKFTMTAKKLAAITVFSEEVTEESIIPVLGFLQDKIVRSQANAEERCTLDGDTTGTHMDNDVSAATDARKAFKGLRKLTQDVAGGANWFELATFNIETVRVGRARLDDAFGENPEDLVYIINVPTLLKMINFPEVMTMDKYNGRATIVTGELGNIDGIPLITSKYQRKDLAATGVNTVGGPNTKSVLGLVNRRGFWFGDRREMAVDAVKFVISGQGLLVVSRRLEFKDIYPVASTGNKTVAFGRNITNP